MAKLFGILALLSYISGVSAEVCSAAYTYYGYYYYTYTYYYVYCSEGCCGYYYDRKCCSSTAGTIAGAVIGCVFFIACIIVIIIVIKKCNAKRTGVVVTGQTSAPGGNVTVVNTHQPQPYGGYPQPVYHQPQYGGHPVGGAAYPPPPPPPGAYPPPPNVPGQPVTY